MRLHTVSLTLLAALMLAGLTGCATGRRTAAPAGEDLSALVARVQPSVVTIQILNPENEPVGLGTGFFVSRRGELITNFHVMENAYGAVVRTIDGQTYPVEQVVAEAPKADLVKLAVGIPVAERHWLEVTDHVPAVAERIIVVGSPLGLEQTVSEGIVSAIREIPGSGRIFQMSAPISRGSSGSPVIDRRGQVIGVVSFQAQAGQNLNFAVAGANVLAMQPLDEPLGL